MDDYRWASSYAELVAGTEANRELQSAIDKNLGRVMQPGEQVHDWHESGIDMDEVLSAAAGGSASNVFMRERADDVSFASNRPFHEFFGAAYMSYPVFGTEAMFGSARDEQDEQRFGLARVGPGVWLETVDRAGKVGKASCSGSGSEAARLYTNRPFASLNKLEKSTLAAYVAGAHRNDVVVCSVGATDGEARWRSIYFLPDGRRLPVFDREAPRTRIIPRAEAARLIAAS
jgi:hypothetical protein